MTTEIDETGQPPLSLNQMHALRHLVSGQSISATALEVGVSRQTVSKWKNEDAVFGLTLNQISIELLDASIKRRKSLDRMALHAVEDALMDGDAKVAMQWLTLRNNRTDWDRTDRHELEREVDRLGRLPAIQDVEIK